MVFKWLRKKKDEDRVCSWCGARRMDVFGMVVEDKSGVTVCNNCIAFAVSRMDNMERVETRPGETARFYTLLQATMQTLTDLDTDAPETLESRLMDAAVALSEDRHDELQTLCTVALRRNWVNGAARVFARIPPGKWNTGDRVNHAYLEYERGAPEKGLDRLAALDGAPLTPDDAAVVAVNRVCLALACPGDLPARSLETWLEDMRQAENRLRASGAFDLYLATCVACNRAECQLKLGRPKEAAASLAVVAQDGVVPVMPRWQLLQGDVLAADGDLPGARQHWEAARAAAYPKSVVSTHAQSRLVDGVSPSGPAGVKE